MRMQLAFALVMAAMTGGAAVAADPGRDVYARHCRTCHGGTAPADSSLGPSLVGLIGAKAGTQTSGLHSRALTESGIVWDRESLRPSATRGRQSPARSCRYASRIPRRLSVCSITSNRFAERPKPDETATPL